MHALATKFLNEPMHAIDPRSAGRVRVRDGERSRFAASQQKVGIGSVDEGMVANTAIRQLVEAAGRVRLSLRLSAFGRSWPAEVISNEKDRTGTRPDSNS